MAMTVKPSASATPRSPTCLPCSVAVPTTARTRKNVPTSSAAYFMVFSASNSGKRTFYTVHSLRFTVDSKGKRKKAKGKNLHRSHQHDGFLFFAGDLRHARADEHVHFAAHAEFRQIDSGLDGEAGVGHELALVLGLEVIHVGAVGVYGGADGMA